MFQPCLSAQFVQVLRAYGFGSAVPALLTIIASAVMHEYMMAIGLGFCLPMVSVLFGGAGGEFWCVCVCVYLHVCVWVWACVCVHEAYLGSMHAICTYAAQSKKKEGMLHNILWAYKSSNDSLAKSATF